MVTFSRVGVGRCRVDHGFDAQLLAFLQAGLDGRGVGGVEGQGYAANLIVHSSTTHGMISTPSFLRGPMLRSTMLAPCSTACGHLAQGAGRGSEGLP